MDQSETNGTPGQSQMPAQNPAIWPPPPTSMPFGQSEEVNTSGMKGEVPPEIARLKWNWGAFCLPFLWSLSHKLAWGWAVLAITFASRLPGLLGGLFALVYFAFAIYLGLKGHTLAWQNRRFPGGEAQYFTVQRKWLGWGIFILILSLPAGLLGIVGSHLGGHSVVR